MLTAIECQKNGIEFAAVHDSFWTHASDITRMNTILRQQFVNLHGSPLIETLDESFQSRFPHEKFPAVPKKGNFDLENIKKSTYFFS